LFLLHLAHCYYYHLVEFRNKLKRVVKEQKGARGRTINFAIVLANNHYAGFGPETATIFRKMIGLPS
jgi:hypothetical protein